MHRNNKPAYHVPVMNEIRPKSSDTLGVLLTESARLLRRRFDQKARVFGLTRAQWDVLKLLYHNEGINQAGLADLLEVEPITLCRQIDRMEEAGWVERRADPGDRRARLLHMTDKSCQVMAQARAIAEELYTEALAGLRPEQVTQLMTALRHVRNNLSHRRTDDPQKVSL